MRSLYTLFTTGFLCVMLFVHLPTAQAQQYLYYPSAFQVPTIETCCKDNGDFLYDDSGFVPEKPWLVYSVSYRDATFENQTLSTKKQGLQFMQRYFLLSKTNDGNAFQLLYNARNVIHVEHKKIDTNTEYRNIGWVHRNNLLLWNKCLYSTAGRSSLKALTISKSKINASVIAKKAFVSGYASPDKNDSVMQFHPFTLVYVYKTSEKSKRYLVGEVNSINEAKLNKYKPQFAWVDTNDLFMWQTNVYIDINDDSAAQKQMADAGFYPSYFNTDEQASIWKSGALHLNARESYWSSDTIQRGYQMRPILMEVNTDDTDVIKVIGVDKYLDTFDYTKYNETLWLQKRQIRVALVMDYETFRQNNPIIREITSAIRNGLKDATLKDSVRYSCTVYFSSKNHVPDISTDSFGTAEYINDWVSRINQSWTNYISDNSSPSNYVFKSIDRAVDAFRNVNTTNLLVLIGNKPDTTGDIENNDKISRNMSNKNINTIGLQLCALRGPHNDDYILQMQDIIKMTGKYKMDTIHALHPNDSLPYSSSPNFYQIDSEYYALNLGGIMSYLKFPHPKPLEVSCLHVDTTLEIINTLNKIIAENRESYNDAKTHKRILKPDTIRRVKRMSWELLMANLDTSKIKFMGALDYGLHGFITPAYTSMRYKDIDYPVFKRYLLVTENEYDSLKDHFKNIRDALSSTLSKDRKIDTIKDAMRQIVIAYMGDLEVIPGNIKYLGITELDKFISEINIYSPQYKRMVHELAGGGRIPTSHLEAWEIFYRNTYSKILKLKNNPRYKRDFPNREVYYWIPEDILIPGRY